MMKQLVNKRRIDVQEDMIPWKGSRVLPYTVGTWFNKDLAPKSVFNTLSPEEQDLLKSGE
jgi:hypothetical protein